MRIRGIAAIAGIVAGLVVVSGGALVAAGVALHTTAGVKAIAEPSPILGPITPAGHPYDQLAILRRQRMSDDVIPDGALDSTGDRRFVADSARLVASTKSLTLWVIVDTRGEACFYSTFGSGSASSCAPATATSASGRILEQISFGGHDDFELVTDGQPASGVILAGYRQIAPNVWMDGRSRVTPALAPASPHDPLAFPLQAPYSHVALLRREATAADTEPASWSKDDSNSVADDILPTSLRRAGTFMGSTAWVGVRGDGDVCLLLSDASGPNSSACGPVGRGVAFQVSAGDNGDGGTFTLDGDGADNAADNDKAARPLAPNVWVEAPSS